MYKTTLAIALALSLFVLSGSLEAQGPDPGPKEKDIPSDLDLHFVDDRDSGDDPFRAGCHWHFGNKQCSAAKMFFSGDYCNAKKTHLWEWTGRSCHEVSEDKKVYDCARICQQRRGVSGRCVVQPNYCGAQGRDSAYCSCDDGSGPEALLASDGLAVPPFLAPKASATCED